MTTASPDRARSPRSAPIRLALLCALAALITYLIASRTGFGRSLDRSAMPRPRGGDTPYVNATWVFSKVYVKSVIVAASAVVAIALIRRRPTLAVMAGALIAVAPTASAALKHALPAAEPIRGFVTGYPSGHVAATLAIGLAAIIVASPRWRPGVAVLASFGTAIMSVSAVVIHAHRASDVVGAYFLTTAIATGEIAIVVAARGSSIGGPSSVPQADRADPTVMRPVLIAPAVIVASLAVVVVATAAEIDAQFSTSLATVTVVLAALASMASLVLLVALSDPAAAAALR